MRLPVSNKKDALGKLIVLGIILLASPLIFHSLIYQLLPFYIIVSCLVVIYSVFYLRKNNIKSLDYKNKQLIVRWNKKNVEIPTNRIKCIRKGIGGVDIKLRMTMVYKIIFKDVYPFGSSIYITYGLYDNSKDFIEDDPHEIVILKEEIKLHLS